MKKKRKKKTVRFVPLTRKEPLSQRTVLELLSGSESTQLVKTSTPARIEVKTSAKKLPSARTSLLLEEKPLANQVERNQKRKQREWLWKGLEGLNITNPGDNPPTACNSASTKRSMESSSTQSRTSEMLRKELRSLRTLIRVRRQPVPTKVD